MKKNILIIMADQLKASSLNLYNKNGIVTPNIAKLKNDGIVYNNCYTSCPLCSPARVSFFTSTFPTTNGYRDNTKLMDGSLDHSFKIWKNNGYKTGLVGKNHCFGVEDYNDYFDYWNEISHVSSANAFKCKGLEWLGDREKLMSAQKLYDLAPRKDLHKTPIVCNYDACLHSTFAIKEQTEKIIELNKNNPFALWVSFPYPHEPYAAPQEYIKKAKDKFVMPQEFDEKHLEKMPERMKILYTMLNINDREKLKEVLTVYYANILMIDEAVGGIVEKLKNENLYENTIIVLMSDHGEFAGEFNMMVKGGMFFDCLTKVPLIIANGGVKDEATNELVSLVDVIPTLLKFQNIGIHQKMQGKPLPVITEEKPRNYVVSEYGTGVPLLQLECFNKLEPPYNYDTIFKTIIHREAEGRRKMVRAKEWKYIYDPMGDMDELYNLKNDPDEWRNLAEKSEYKDVVLNMKSMLLEHSILLECGYMENDIIRGNKI